MRLPHLLCALLVSITALSGCTDNDQTPDTAPAQSEESEQTTGSLAPLDPAVSLSDAGQALYPEAARPRYDVTAEVDPTTGEILGTLSANLPIGEASEATFRFLPGLPDLDTDPDLGSVQVAGEEVTATIDDSLIRVPLPPGRSSSVQVSIPFSYTLPLQTTSAGGLLGGLLGGDLNPAEIGLLARHENSVNLGHWFPLWIPAGRSADPELDGFGDLGNFDAADIGVSLTVPHDWAVVDSGIQTSNEASGGERLIQSQGSGMRDFAIAVVHDYQAKTRDLDGALEGVSITATAPTKDAGELDEVLDETEVSIRTLSEDLGSYPWREFDVVSAPLGASVGGMEWPGATWIEAGTFGGGIPGLGNLDLDELGLGDIDLGELGGLGDLTSMLGSARQWTIAHEVAHSWWTLLVGNDSLASPVVDEPLAQYSACLVVRAALKNGESVCAEQINSGYSQMRLLGEPDSVADQASDEFASGLQYGGVIYGKAAAFWLRLERTFGRASVIGALRSLIKDSAFTTIDGPAIRSHLVTALGAAAGPMWDRWMTKQRGDKDLEVDGTGDLNLGDLNLGDLELGDLEGLLSGLQSD